MIEFPMYRGEDRTVRIDPQGQVEISARDTELSLYANNPAGRLLRAERWHSSEARSEIHYFIAGTDTYVIGFNPDNIPEDRIKDLLRRLGFRYE